MKIKCKKKKKKEHEHFSGVKRAALLPVLLSGDARINGGKKLSLWSIQPIIDHPLMITVHIFSIIIEKGNIDQPLFSPNCIAALLWNPTNNFCVIYTFNPWCVCKKSKETISAQNGHMKGRSDRRRWERRYRRWTLTTWIPSFHFGSKALLIRRERGIEQEWKHSKEIQNYGSRGVVKRKLHVLL